MKSLLRDLLKQYFLPKWIVLVYDLSVMGIVFIFTIYLVANFSIQKVVLHDSYHQIVASALIFFVVFLTFKPHHNIIRHATLKDFSSIIAAHIIGSSGLLWLSVMGRYDASFAQYAIPYPVIIIHFFISTFILLFSRLFIKAIYHFLILKPEFVQNAMIFGAGRLGMIARDVLEQNNQLNYNVVGFIDDNPNLHGKNISLFSVRSYISRNCKDEGQRDCNCDWAMGNIA